MPFGIAGQVQAIFLSEGASIGMLGAALGLGLARLLVFPADGWVHGLIEKQMMGPDSCAF